MRFGGIYDDEFQVAGSPFNGGGKDPSNTGANAPDPESPSPAPQQAPQAPETPVNTPGPANNPQAGQAGPPPPSPPPALATGQGAGLVGSETTGGLKGSFAQAGDADFARRFGGDSPAVWFRNFGREGQRGRGPGTIMPGDNRNATTRGGGQSGGAIPAVSAIPPGPQGGPEGGGKQDEEWQRFMRSVIQQRFGAPR